MKRVYMLRHDSADAKLNWIQSSVARSSAEALEVSEIALERERWWNAPNSQGLDLAMS